ncbi:MAG: single-stranded-DNA-specific exonuclease RecJ [Desulfobacterales bacterium]|nr:single-stranded-DNA-specific exonuclease RecJ [Desulfobacterales bacterium]
MEPSFTYAKPDPIAVDDLSQALDCHPILASLLTLRGITSVEDAHRFLSPGFDQLSDPFDLKDMKKAVQRILTAVKNREKILIFGDFDADGVTATALLYDFLDHCDANVSWYIPHRIKEGYSLSASHIPMAVDQDIDLILTVDCGVSSHDAVSLARGEDIDVIVTDHHEAGDRLPNALAIIDPKRKDCPAGLEHLAGVGVAFFLVMALRKHFRESHFWDEICEPNLLDYLDLFVIGTIGDMVPLIKENRVLCLAGLSRIRKGKRPGLAALAQVSRVDPTRIDSDDITFKIVPRINAAGRISHARICVSQLTDTDVVNTEKTASFLDQLNSKRQKIEQQIVQEIEWLLLKNPAQLNDRLLFLWDDQWNPSVLGIAASKLCRKYHIPVILLSSGADQAIGSGRSIDQINIHEALSRHSDLIVKFGGHAFASGLTVKKENLSTLRKTLKHYFNVTYSDDAFQKTIKIDAVLDLDDITYELATEINRLRPFGVANPEPVFMSENIQVISSFIIGANHRKMILKKASSPNGVPVEAFHFNVDDPEQFPEYFPKITYKLKINKFKNQAVQIIIEGN